MKYFSEITKKNYDTVEELEKAEAKIKKQMEEKVPADVAPKADATVANERKEAAQAVEKAFALASQKKKENSAKREELDKQSREIDKRYRAKFDEAQKVYDEKCKEISVQQEEEEEKLSEQYLKLDKADEEAVADAYKALADFCKKYGAYHYSVDTAGADLFPLLFGFNQIEKTKNLFGDMFNSLFRWF